MRDEEEAEEAAALEEEKKLEGDGEVPAEAKKISELYDIFTNLINDKINLNKKLIDQDAILKTLREKLNELLDAKAAKKGVIDMHKFYPGKKSHPPKMQIFSKYDNRKGTRSY